MDLFIAVLQYFFPFAIVFLWGEFYCVAHSLAQINMGMLVACSFAIIQQTKSGKIPSAGFYHVICCCYFILIEITKKSSKWNKIESIHQKRNSVRRNCEKEFIHQRRASKSIFFDNKVPFDARNFSTTCERFPIQLYCKLYEINGISAANVCTFACSWIITHVAIAFGTFDSMWSKSGKIIPTSWSMETLDLVILDQYLQTNGRTNMFTGSFVGKILFCCSFVRSFAGSWGFISKNEWNFQLFSVRAQLCQWVYVCFYFLKKIYIYTQWIVWSVSFIFPLRLYGFRQYGLRTWEHTDKLSHPVHIICRQDTMIRVIVKTVDKLLYSFLQNKLVFCRIKNTISFSYRSLYNCRVSIFSCVARFHSHCNLFRLNETKWKHGK